jgi:hypothetical protein
LVPLCLAALQGFDFHPYTLNAQPIAVESQISFRFTIKGRGDKAKGRVEYLKSAPSQPEPHMFRISDPGVLLLDPRKISAPQVELPSDMGGHSGDIYFTVLVGADGKVQDAKMTGGNESFTEPALRALKQYVYEPYLVAGNPSAFTTQEHFRFTPP